jgi:hypothetical protein
VTHDSAGNAAGPPLRFVKVGTTNPRIPSPPQFHLRRIPKLELDHQSERFTLDPPLPLTIICKHKYYLQDNAILTQFMIFHALFVVFSDTSLSAENRPTFAKANPVGYQSNSNVSKILPVTTFRTIDLGGRKISGPLFSRF